MKKHEALIFRFRHFSYRLSERYGILITFEYYCLLCSIYLKEIKVIRPDTDSQVLEGHLKINGIDVRVRKQMRGHRLLLTALPNKKKNETDNKTRKVLPGVHSPW